METAKMPQLLVNELKNVACLGGKSGEEVGILERK
jgi:hypothetical protein